MTEHDREYTLFVRPYARLRVAFSRDERGLGALSASIDYDRAGLPEVTDTEAPAPRGIEWRDLELDVYRDGERLLGGAPSDVDTEELVAYLERLNVYARRLARGLQRRREH